MPSPVSSGSMIFSASAQTGYVPQVNYSYIGVTLDYMYTCNYWSKI